MKIPICSIVVAWSAAGFAGAVAFERHHLSEKFYAEGASVGDFNKDGTQDIVSGPYWYQGPEFETRHAIYDTKDYPPKGYSRNFNTWAYDIDGDGWDDVLRVTFPGDAAVWHQNPGGDGTGEWKEHRATDVVDNESPQFGDLTGDGKPELVFSIGGKFVYAPINEKKPTDKWPVHPISGEKATGGKFTHGLGLGDVDGDGRTDLLAKDKWFMQPDSLEGDPEWRELRFQFSGPGGADMFAYDFDGDGDNDIYTSAAAHAYGLTWFEQAEGEGGKKIWRRHVITGEKPEDSKHGVVFSQAHSAQLVDMDGDGVKDLITGKRWWAHNGNDPGGNDAAVLYWFKVVPGGKSGDADFVPHLIDEDSGVGTQFVVEDLNGDKRPDIIVGNKKGTFVHLQTDAAAGANAAPPGGGSIFEDGDRVALIGNTFIEREGNYGHVETALTIGAAAEGKRVTFRNLGWSGDTVFGHARSYFGPPEEGFDRLRKHIEMIQPTLIVLNYGAVASFDGEAREQEFIDGYRRLIAMAREASGGARVALMSPARAESLGRPLPDMSAQNERLSSYTQAIAELANADGHAFLDLFSAMSRTPSTGRSLTDNGIHFTADGYAHLAPIVATLAGFTTPVSMSESAEQLRAVIREKNQLFFHRWRPQNETYLHGFRKHEQGNNAVEIPQFDPLVEAKDREIQSLAAQIAP